MKPSMLKALTNVRIYDNTEYHGKKIAIEVQITRMQ